MLQKLYKEINLPILFEGAIFFTNQLLHRTYISVWSTIKLEQWTNKETAENREQKQGIGKIGNLTYKQ